MKRYILIACILVMGYTTAQAQFTLGIKGGLNYSSVKAKEGQVDQSGILGYQIGAWARIGKGFYVQPEAYIGTKGSDFKFASSSTNTNVDASTKVKFTTLDVPILLGKTIGMERLNLRIMAGPLFSFILDENKNGFDQVKDTFSDFSNYKKAAIALQAGAGVDLGSLSVDLRYEAGLSNLNAKYSQKQNLVHLSLGWKIL